MGFVIHWHESAMELHVLRKDTTHFPILKCYVNAMRNYSHMILLKDFFIIQWYKLSKFNILDFLKMVFNHIVFIGLMNLEIHLFCILSSLHKTTVTDTILYWPVLLLKASLCTWVRAWLVTSVVSDSLWSCGPHPSRPLCPWGSPGKNTGVDCHALIQGNYPIQGLNPCHLCLLHWQVGFLHLGPPEKP